MKESLLKKERQRDEKNSTQQQQRHQYEDDHDDDDDDDSSDADSKHKNLSKKNSGEPQQSIDKNNSTKSGKLIFDLLKMFLLNYKLIISKQHILKLIFKI